MEAVLRAHGSRSDEILALVAADPSLGRPVAEGWPVIGAQVVHAVSSEMAQRLDDVVLRRTDLWLAPGAGKAMLVRCAALAAKAAGWDRGREVLEIDRAETAVAAMRPAPGRAEDP